MTIVKRVKVEPGGVIEVRAPELPDGAEAEVVITVPESELVDESYDPEARPIWEIVAEIGAAVPEEVWARVPEDLSINFRHYLYGAPKEEE
ncbi:MAG TPA: hypothetical protein VL025_21185 [Thermoanaerobaculia bacterium]|nr:hypothetical protein [Thermoanaerobaculia bacterium]